MEESDLECPVCFESLIAPYALQCSHTICAACFMRNKKTMCPMCRFDFKSKRNCAVNIVLEKFLRKQIPDYDSKKKEVEHILQANKILTKYNDSERALLNVRKLTEYLNENDHYILVSDIPKKFPDIPVEEMHYIMDRSRSGLVLNLCVKQGEDEHPREPVAVYIDVLDLDYISTIRQHFKLSHEDLLNIVCKLENNLETVVRPCLSGKPITLVTDDNYAFVEQLIALEADNLKKRTSSWVDVGMEWGTDSDSDSDTDAYEAYTLTFT